MNRKLIVLPRLRSLAASLLWIALVAALALPLAAQSEPPFDSGVQALIDAGLITVVDQTSEHDGVQVTIQYAYADTQRIIIRLKLSGDYEPVLRDNMVNAVLRDDTGRRFSYNAMHPVVREDDELAEVYDLIFYNQAVFQAPNGEFSVFDDYLNDKGDRIDLQLDLGFTPISALGMVLDAVDALEKSPVGPFGFIFTAPIYQPREIKPRETVTIGDITVRLERVTVTPSETEVEVCYSLPDAQDWQPAIVLAAGAVSVPASGANLVGMPTLEDTERCVEQRFSLFIGATTDALTVNIERLQTSVPDAHDAWEGFVAELESFDIQAEAFPQPGAYYSIQTTPEGMTDAELAEIINNARDNLRHSVEGPWVFEVVLAD